MKWPGSGTHANRSKEYENDSRFRNYDPHRLPPEGASAIAMLQEAILAGYCIPQPNMQSFSTAQLPQPAMLAGGAYLPPAGGAQYAMNADYRVAQQTEAERTLRENQSRELLLYARWIKRRQQPQPLPFQAQSPIDFMAPPFITKGCRTNTRHHHGRRSLLPLMRPWGQADRPSLQFFTPVALQLRFIES